MLYDVLINRKIPKFIYCLSYLPINISLIYEFGCNYFRLEISEHNYEVGVIFIAILASKNDDILNLFQLYFSSIILVSSMPGKASLFFCFSNYLKKNLFQKLYFELTQIHSQFTRTEKTYTRQQQTKETQVFLKKIN